MEVLMFGRLRIQVDGKSLGAHQLGGVKPKQILEMLLISRGHLVSTDALADGLWPCKPPRDAAATLNTYVSVLRHHLFEDQAEARRVIFTAPRAYGFSMDDAVVDLDTFDDLVIKSELAIRSDRIRLLTSAVELVRGSVLEDALDDEWTREERLAYDRGATRAHLRLSADFLGEGVPLRALRHAHSGLKISPYSEEAVRLIMVANYAMGLDDAARTAHERCRTTIGDELGLDITSATAGLAGAIDAGVPACELINEVTTPSFHVAHNRRSTDVVRDLSLVG